MFLDENIIADPAAFAHFLSATCRPVLASMAFRTNRSKDSALVQLADIVAGFNRSAVDIAVGRPNKQVVVFDDGLGDDIDIDLLTYICWSFRWNTWGEVPPPPNPADPRPDGTWPFKHVGGYGLRIHSTISTDLKEQIYAARVVYMGCLH